MQNNPNCKTYLKSNKYCQEFFSTSKILKEEIQSFIDRKTENQLVVSPIHEDIVAVLLLTKEELISWYNDYQTLKGKHPYISIVDWMINTNGLALYEKVRPLQFDPDESDLNSLFKIGIENILKPE